MMCPWGCYFESRQQGERLAASSLSQRQEKRGGTGHPQLPEEKGAETDRHEEYPQVLAGAHLGRRCALGVPMASLPSTARGTNKAPLQAAQRLLVDELGQTTQPPWADFLFCKMRQHLPPQSEVLESKRLMRVLCRV